MFGPLLADEVGTLAAVSNVLKVFVAVGVSGLCIATWWLAGRYYQTRTKIAEAAAKAAKAARNAALAAEQHATQSLTTCQVQLSQTGGKLHDEQQKRHAAEQERDQARHDLQTASGKLAAASNLCAERQAEIDQLRLDVSVLRHQTGATVGELTAKTQALARLEKRMAAALKLEGQLWNARALQKRPKFREMSQRRRAIVSVLNLKGGVGKTTVTAHLGAALARRGYRVLLIDLDLQGSLTSIFLAQDRINAAYANQGLIQHFFQRAAADKTAKLTDYAVEVFRTGPGGVLDIVGATDNLAYAELNLTMRWLMGAGDRDTRFLLRKALHLMSVTDAYDIVLIDCPPLVNISCVNALAASDHVLVPTTLSRKSLERVPNLIRKVLRNEQFVKHINPKLHLLGLLANRTRGRDLTGAECSDWKNAAGWCKDAYGQDVTQFATTVPQIKAVQDSEAAFLPDGGDGRLDEVFADLATEVEGKLPSECRRIAKAHS